MFELGLDAPWYLLSVETAERTVCIAWEPDLIAFLRSHTVVIGIACMMPATQSKDGRWWCREVNEVHAHRSKIGSHVVMIDSTGEAFDSGLKPTHPGVVEKELLWASPRLQGNQVVTRTKNR